MTGITPVISGARLTTKNKRLQLDLEHRINRWSQEQANNISDALKLKYSSANKTVKATAEEDQGIDWSAIGGEDDGQQTELLVGGKKIPKDESNVIRAMVLLSWGAIRWAALVDIFKPYLEAAGEEGVDVGVGQVQMTDARRTQENAKETAKEYADNRSAELAGMKRTADSRLEEDSDARWPLTDVMRRDLEQSITLAVTEKWTVEQLAAVIEASYALSTERATIIANTEMTNAQSNGIYTLWRESGTITLVQWVTSDEHREPDECDNYEDQGVVPLGHEFAEGLFAPRAHPFCLCELQAVDPTDIL